MNFTALEQFITEVTSLSGLTGNSGRKITRWLEKNVKDGGFTFPISMSTKDGKPVSLLEFAWALRRVQTSCSLARMDMEERKFVVYYEIDGLNLKAKTFNLKIIPEQISESMRTRQRLIMGIAAGLSGFIYYVKSSLQTENDILSEIVDPEGEDPLEKRELHEQEKSKFKAMFEKLITGDISEALNTPMTLVSLAGTLDNSIPEKVNALADIQLEQAIEKYWPESFP